MAMTIKTKKIFKFLRKNYFISIFFAVILFTSIIIGAKTILTKSTYVYVKVKMGQGFWWAGTLKPAIWYASSIKKGDIKYDLLGKREVQVVEVRRYPSWSPMWATSQNDVYVTLRLKASLNKKTGEYSFNRSILSIGSPIELQFPRTDITGTVINMSTAPLKDNYVEKIIYLVFQNGYNKDFAYRYDSIAVGGKYFDGEDYVFEVLDKWLEKNILPISNNLNGQVYEREVETTQSIVVKVKTKLIKKENGMYYGQDYKINVNSFVPFSTDNYFFENYVVRKVE